MQCKLAQALRWTLFDTLWLLSPAMKRGRPAVPEEDEDDILGQIAALDKQLHALCVRISDWKKRGKPTEALLLTRAGLETQRTELRAAVGIRMRRMGLSTLPSQAPPASPARPSSGAHDRSTLPGANAPFPEQVAPKEELCGESPESDGGCASPAPSSQACI